MSTTDLNSSGPLLFAMPVAPAAGAVTVLLGLLFFAAFDASAASCSWPSASSRPPARGPP